MSVCCGGYIRLIDYHSENEDRVGNSPVELHQYNQVQLKLIGIIVIIIIYV